ncbi:TIGR03808 family TAT-translocated repetitive protein [Maritalea porphyrae]|uniref:Tat protein n=1 Tax=Maritalea porphyrae TaxID=880732 RepID=A0ABQ5UU51_9HYPH|nr:TIGR03808 family TAT-translocated repetitive protein [Maritalea porphyrae]GLQ17909.1 Tat protein [Maritalea porphyrae]
MISRRGLLTFAGAGFGALTFANKAMAQFGAIDASANGVVANTGSDISSDLSALLEKAASLSQPVYLPAGEYLVSNISLPSGTALYGARGSTRLLASREGPILAGQGTSRLSLHDIALVGTGGALADPSFGLLDFVNCEDVLVEQCHFETASSYGISLYGTGGTITENRFEKIANAAIKSVDATGLSINDNFVDGCGNNGILVWRNDNGHDGTIVTGNHIKNIDWKSGGNGQNGNGINVFRSADVIVANNVITDCTFSAVRANGTVNCQIVGNNCRNLSEVAIFSEFEFSGSIVAQNIIDEAAQGISITNWNDGGHLAVCANNIVRNIWAKSPTNPDTSPVGIGLEADIVANGNVIENVPGTGMAAGWGPYMRNLTLTNNLVQNTHIGIYVSVVEGVGAAQVKDNQISNAKRAPIVGARWDDIVELDLQKASAKYAQLVVADNQFS